MVSPGSEELANVGNNLRVTVFRLRKMLIEAGLRNMSIS